MDKEIQSDLLKRANYQDVGGILAENERLKRQLAEALNMCTELRDQRDAARSDLIQSLKETVNLGSYILAAQTLYSPEVG